MTYWDNLSDEVAQVIAFAQSESTNFEAREVNSLTLFLGIQKNAKCDTAKLLVRLGLTYPNTREVAAKFFRCPEKPGALGRLSQSINKILADKYGIPLSKSVNKTMTLANEEAQKDGINIFAEHLLLSLLNQRDPEVMQLISKLSIDVKNLRNEVLKLVDKKAQYDQTI